MFPPLKMKKITPLWKQGTQQCDFHYCIPVLSCPHGLDKSRNRSFNGSECIGFKRTNWISERVKHYYPRGICFKKEKELDVFFFSYLLNILRRFRGLLCIGRIPICRTNFQDFQLRKQRLAQNLKNSKFSFS